MAKEKNGQSLRDYENRKKRFKKRRRTIIIVLFLILLAAGGAFLYYIYNRNFEGYKVIKTMDSTGKNAAGFLNYGSSMVKYSKDGAEAIDENGSLMWNGSYEMKAPIADSCGKYVAIADRGGKSIQIFNGKGAAGAITTLYDIIKVEVSSQGVIAALMEEGESNYITLYDLDGTTLGEKVTDVSNSGYPIDMALSDNGEKLVISYLSVTKGEILTTIAFLNFGEVGQNYTDRFVGGYKFKDTLIPRVAFLNNNTVCAFKDNGFLIYSMDEIPSLLHKENVKGNIKSILYNDKYIGLVLDGTEDKTNKLMLYSIAGRRTLSKKLDFEYKSISLYKDEIIMYDNQSCIIMKVNGKIKFQYTFDSNITALYPINHRDRYFLINDTDISEISLVE